jgi:hypothetical protein
MKQTSSPLFKFFSAAYLSIWDVAMIVGPFQIAWEQLVPANLREPHIWLTINALPLYAYLCFFTIQRYRHPQFAIQKVASPFPAFALVVLGGLLLYSVAWLAVNNTHILNDWPQFLLVWSVAAIIYVLHPRFVIRLSKL